MQVGNVLVLFITIFSLGKPVLLMMNTHIRSNLARAVYTRMLEDQKEKGSNHDYWYNIYWKDVPEEMAEQFIQFRQDEETEDFLDKCYDKSDWLFTQIYYGLASALLKWFMSQTSVNGLLGRGSMFVFSSKQFNRLIDVENEWKGNKMLDIGAGDGEVTKRMAHHFSEVHVTEMSTPMTWRLQEKAYKVIGIEDWHNGSHKYDLISCLNVLDRCEKPHTLLEDIKTSLVPGTGKAVVAIVIPFSPYVEYKYKDHMPSEMIPVKGETFEEQSVSLIRDFFQPHGFRVEKCTRLPYLCEGDLEHSFFVLYDAVFVLSLVP